MQKGWISIHRSLIAWEWFQRPEMVQIWIYLLLKANHAPAQWQGIEIKRGQLVSGRKTIAKETGLTEQTVRTCLDRLKKSGEINTQVTNRYTVITICNYVIYQDEDLKANQQVTSQKPKINQPIIKKSTNLKSPGITDKKGITEINPEKSTNLNWKNQPAKTEKSTTNNNDINNKNIDNDFLKVKNLFPLRLQPKDEKELNQWKKDYQKLIDLNFSHSEIIEVLTYVRNDEFWKTKVLNIAKLKNKNRDGIRHIDLFIEQAIHEEKPNTIKDWGK